MINWTEFRRLLWGGLFLDNSVFLDLRDAGDGVARALRFVFTLGLIVGLVVAGVALAKDVISEPFSEIREVRDTVDEVFERLEAYDIELFDSERERDLFERNLDAGFAIAEDVVDTIVATTPAPQPVVSLLEGVGKWLSYPFGWIAMWLLWGVVTLLFARILGGTATVQEMLATTSLVVAPHVLEALSFVPCGGPLLQVVAFFWGLAVYIKGTAIANRFGIGSALVAVLAPFILLLALVSALAMVIVFIIVVNS